MSDRRRWVGQGRTILSLCAIAFLGLCLVGYDPADRPGHALEPANNPPSNPCGPVGAALAHFLMTAVGRGAYLLLYASAVMGLLIVRRRKPPELFVQAAGIALLAAVVAASIQKCWPDLGRVPPVGSGGYVGSATLAFLEGQFGPAGFCLTLVALGLVGLGLCRDLLIHAPIFELSTLVRSLRRPRPPDTSASAPVLSGRDGAALMLGEGAARPVPIARLAPPVNRPPPLRPSASIEPAVGLVSPRSFPASASAAPPASNVPSVPDDGDYHLPPVELLEPGVPPIPEHQGKVHARALLLEKTLLEFGCQVRVVQIDTGPVITQFEIELEAGLRVAKINSVANDLAIALAVPSVRIVSPIPNKTTVGIEVPTSVGRWSGSVR